MEQQLNSDSGKIISSKSHQLLKDRNTLILKEIPISRDEEYLIQDADSFISEPINLNFECLQMENFKLVKDSTIAALDYDKLDFPLTLRKWRKGDVFHPLGMRGKKKLSDFFIDKKLSVFEKQNTWIVCTNDKIVWVVGARIDERFKLVENSQKVYLVKLNEI
jgi:tRNA(Ile)-lysidine synthase